MPNNLKTLLEKYSIADYIAFAVGAYLAAFVAFAFSREALNGSYEHWWYHVGAMAVAVVLMYVPQTFVKLFQKTAKLNEDAK